VLQHPAEVEGLIADPHDARQASLIDEGHAGTLPCIADEQRNDERNQKRVDDEPGCQQP